VGAKPRHLLRIARAFEIHPNQLLLLARLTPLLGPGPKSKSIRDRQPLALWVTEEEARRLQEYLIFLRYIAVVNDDANLIEVAGWKGTTAS
jgi:hypothetical protein